MIPLYNNNDDIQYCNNYIGIKLLIHTMKAWERVVEWRVRRVKVSKEVVWRCIEATCDDNGHVNGAKARVRTVGEESEYFSVLMGLYLGLALSLFLFSLAMDTLTHHIQVKMPWYMLFSYDLIDETWDGVNARLEVRRQILESKGFKFSRTKT